MSKRQIDITAKYRESTSRGKTSAGKISRKFSPITPEQFIELQQLYENIKENQEHYENKKGMPAKGISVLADMIFNSKEGTPRKGRSARVPEQVDTRDMTQTQKDVYESIKYFYETYIQSGLVKLDKEKKKKAEEGFDSFTEGSIDVTFIITVMAAVVRAYYVYSTQDYDEEYNELFDDFKQLFDDKDMMLEKGVKANAYNIFEYLNKKYDEADPKEEVEKNGIKKKRKGYKAILPFAMGTKLGHMLYSNFKK